MCSGQPPQGETSSGSHPKLQPLLDPLELLQHPSFQAVLCYYLRRNSAVQVHAPRKEISVTSSALVFAVAGCSVLYEEERQNQALVAEAFYWAGNFQNQGRASALNDDDILIDFSLFGGDGDDAPGAWESGGLIWETEVSIDRIEYFQGSYTLDYNGIFDAEFGLQILTRSGWEQITNWSVSPEYTYDSQVSGLIFTFEGESRSVLGARVVGRVHTKDTFWSGYALAREIRAY